MMPFNPLIPVPVAVRLKREGAKMPTYAHTGLFGDQCADLYYCGSDPVELMPGDRYTFNTGIGLELPMGFCGIIDDKSGLASKHGLHVLGGRVDCGYSGEINVVLINLDQHNRYIIEPGDKIAQIQITPFYQATFFLGTDVTRSTERSDKGFGSTGR